MKRKSIVALSVVSLLLAIATCLLWGRGQSGVDETAIRYDRYLTDGSAASNDVYLTSDHRLWLSVQAGTVAPYNGRLVWGYYVNADQSGGKPRLTFERSRYKTHFFASDGRSPTDDHTMSGWGPLRWQNFHRSGNGEHFQSITIGVSHWLVAASFLLCPFGLYLRRHSSRALQPG